MLIFKLKNSIGGRINLSKISEFCYNKVKLSIEVNYNHKTVSRAKEKVMILFI